MSRRAAVKTGNPKLVMFIGGLEQKIKETQVQECLEIRQVSRVIQDEFLCNPREWTGNNPWIIEDLAVWSSCSESRLQYQRVIECVTV